MFTASNCIRHVYRQTDITSGWWFLILSVKWQLRTLFSYEKDSSTGVYSSRENDRIHNPFQMHSIRGSVILQLCRKKFQKFNTNSTINVDLKILFRKYFVRNYVILIRNFVNTPPAYKNTKKRIRNEKVFHFWARINVHRPTRSLFLFQCMANSEKKNLKIMSHVITCDLLNQLDHLSFD